MPLTIPILTGYIFLGMAYGILMNDKGYGLGWVLLMSIGVFAGSMQFAGIILLSSAFNPMYALILTLIINARHLFYGVAMLGRYKGMGKIKPYLSFGLTDETFSVACSVSPPEGIEKEKFYFWITFLNHFYWVLGSVLGNLLGNFIPFDTTGLDFALTALFVVIFMNQWKEQKNHTPALIGLGASVLCLVLFGKENFIIPAMVMILLFLGVFKKKMEDLV
jgi:4-azaleucine resistance transporter AzlC